MQNKNKILINVDDRNKSEEILTQSYFQSINKIKLFLFCCEKQKKNINFCFWF